MSATANATPEPAAGDLRRRDVALHALPASGVTFLYSLVIVMYMNYGNLVLGVAPGVLGRSSSSPSCGMPSPAPWSGA